MNHHHHYTTTPKMVEMELSRSEYPALVQSIPATPAVKLLRDRLQKGQALNNEIADWLQERRRVEDAYAQALTKLAKRPLPGEASELGVFGGPWSRIVESTSTLATSHANFAAKIDLEVERPIRDFAIRNSEWAGMKMMEGNLGAAAKAIDAAEERAEKLRKRGQKAKAQQVMEAANAVSNANAEWDSQAPFVFEKLQAADESRCNSLRDALTRLQTLELDHAQSSMQAAEATLTVILDISTSDEIKSFAAKATHGQPRMERKSSRSGPAGPHQSTPSIVADDSVSFQSSHSGGTAGGAHGLGLKRLGTVLRNRSNRNSMFYRSSSPDKRPRPPLPPSPHSLKNDGQQQSTSIPSTPTADNDPPTPAPPQSNGDHILPPSAPGLASPPPSSGGAPSVTISSEEPRTDSEGYSIPPPVHDLGASPLSDDGAIEESQPQFKVEIKNDVIREEEEEADAALSKVANTLRAQNTVSRKTRGRRDVRNTVFFPSPPELAPDLTGSPPLTPMRLPSRSGMMSEGESDTHSIKSARSITSLAAAAIRHPELNEPGLSASVVESVAVTFEAGQPVKSLVAGEIALAYHPLADTEEPNSIIRMDNFTVLEKVAPNPSFITTIPDRTGEYSVLNQNIRGTSVAFKYQVHVDEASLSAFAPIIVSPVWRLGPHQSDVIVKWKPNPNYRRLTDSTNPIVLRNVIFITGIEGAHAASCQSKPMGFFSKEKGRLAWKLGDVTIDPTQEAGGKVLARFTTDAQARSMPVEVRWAITGDDTQTVGSGLGLSVMGKAAETATEEEAADPFADAGVEDKSTNGAEPAVTWTPVTTARRITSAKYVAS